MHRPIGLLEINLKNVSSLDVDDQSINIILMKSGTRFSFRTPTNHCSLPEVWLLGVHVLNYHLLILTYLWLFEAVIQHWFLILVFSLRDLYYRGKQIIIIHSLIDYYKHNKQHDPQLVAVFNEFQKLNVSASNNFSRSPHHNLVSTLLLPLVVFDMLALFLIGIPALLIWDLSLSTLTLLSNLILKLT